MAVTIQEDLPGGITRERLQDELRLALGRPTLAVERVECTPVEPVITAPSTGSLTRVRVTGGGGGPVELRVVAKCLQTALHGLPPFIPLEDRQRIAAGIPWRLEAEGYTAGTAGLMPAGPRGARAAAGG